MKKLIALVLALALVLTCCAVAFADNDGSVTVDNAVPGETYKIYKLFDLTYSGSDETSSGTLGGDTAKSGVAYTYTKSGDSDSLYTALITDASPFTLTASATANLYNVSLKDSKTAGDISAWMKTNESLLRAGADPQSKVAPAATGSATTSSVSWTGLSYGYYYVTSTVGSLVTIDSTLKAVTVKDKNEIPGLNKTITGVTEGSTAKNGNIYNSGKDAHANIGDVITYTATISAKKGAENYIFHDTLSAGLTLKEDVAVVISDGNTLTAGAEGDYVVKYFDDTAASADSGDVKEGDNITIRFNKSYLDTITTDKNITIVYKATVNDSALVAGTTGNKNDSHLEYGHSPSSESTPNSDTGHSHATVWTYGIALVKVDAATGNRLPGATFTLPFYYYTTAAADGSYVYAGLTAGEGKSNTFTTTSENNCQITIKGLDRDEALTIVETQAPSGYNKLRTNVTVTPEQLTETTTSKTWKIKDGEIVADSVETSITTTYTNSSLAVTPVAILNNSGTELPSTGGIGTTIFYILGGLLVVGAAVILVARRKASN